MNIKINDVVDITYLMNMDRRPDRLEYASEQLKSNGIEFERYCAVDGTAVLNPTRMNAGQYGNYLSHLGILEQCMINGIDRVMIFEDDVEFCQDFEDKFSRLYPLIPEDWDMVYLGFNRIAGTEHPTDREEIVKITGAYAIHAFMLNRKAIRIAYNFMSRNKVQADVYYAELQKSLNVYSFKEQLCSQRPDYSDIENSYVNYRWVFGWQQ